ncbi:S-methyl-5-thioribose kinase [Alphaproteobacteria bacterium]|nr:S-methyl-5-thioribose kinase [Alphaproteobacteria bacterium]
MSSNFRPKNYQPLEVSTIKNFIENSDKIKNIIGDTKEIEIKEVGDGNLNLVFFVESKKNSICIKQPLPYLRVLKDWPLTLKRSYYESEYMNIHSNHVADLMPKIYDFDPELCTITMEKLSPHIIMRHGLINATKYEKFAEDISTFMAKTLFFTSDLYLKADQKKELNSRFIMNTELCKITEDLIFTDPYMYNKNNRWTTPHLDKQKKEIENNDDLKIAVSRLKIKFMSESQSLLHGDLHTGSIMVSENDTKVIDPEFAFYGPMGFDIGALLANLLMNFFSQNGHENNFGERKEFKKWILNLINMIWIKFENKFCNLWNDYPEGDAYPTQLFNNKQIIKREQKNYLQNIYNDSIGFAGAKIIRRIFGFAHNIDFDWIKDDKIRAICENKCANLGIDMQINPSKFKNISSLIEEAIKLDNDSISF